ncbi:MAG: YicC family protein [Desulfobacterales bacterium]|nr:MAG: YicC family protein [Desulfobacterales bacterium]
MLKSMTGFATAETTCDKLTTTTEIRSYNSRFLDLALRLSNGYQPLEEKIKGCLTERLARGRIDVKVQIEDRAEPAVAFEIDRPRALAFHAALAQLKADFNIEKEISLDLLVGAGGVVKPVDRMKDLDAVWPAVQDCLRQALDALEDMRQREGAFVAKDIGGRLDYLAKCIEQIQEAAADLPAHYRDRLKERISVLTQEMIEIDPARVAQEAALLADRSDISEELVRARSHIQLFREIMDSSEPGGKKLNFVLQELNREFNTMGSKIGSAEVAHIIIAVKSELEKIREQVQNIE